MSDLHRGDSKKDADVDVEVVHVASPIDNDLLPSDEDLATLRRVRAPMPWAALAMCLVEFAERASYYGCQAVFFNFVKNPLPAGGNGAGAVAKGYAGANQSAGALGLGLVAANAVTKTFEFLAYVMPIVGGILADTRYGRFKAICIGTFVGAVSHVILVIPAIPSVLSNPNGSLAAFLISILILAAASGFIKPSLAPLLCDQIPVKHPMLKTTKSGERVIVDPQLTIQHWLVLFYWTVNVGGFFAIATTYTSRLIGFWLANLLPGIIYALVPIVFVIVSKRLYKAPPGGSVVTESITVIKVLLANGGWKKMWKGGDDFWNTAKPTQMAANGVAHPNVFWDDMFVDEIRKTMNACACFALAPIFHMANGGLGNAMGAMSVAMTLNSVPNDLLSRFNPLSIIIFSPILSYGIYPLFERWGRPIKPMTRICIGFLLASVGDIVAAIVQDKIYKSSPCGNRASECEAGVSPVSLWWQMIPVCVPAIGELFVNVTSYELGYTLAPARMKGLVNALFLFSFAISSAVSLALSKVVNDPYLVWHWVALACASFVTAWVFPTYFRHLNHPVENFADEDRMRGAIEPTQTEVKGRDEDKY